MQFFHNLYVGAGIKDREKVCQKLKSGAGQLTVYVITLAQGKDQLEFYHCARLQQRAFRELNPFIVGLASGYEEAMELVQEIVEDIFAKTGNYNIKEYFAKEDVSL